MVSTEVRWLIGNMMFPASRCAIRCRKFGIIVNAGIDFTCVQAEPLTKFHEGHLVESETYIGGHVECLEVRDVE